MKGWERRRDPPMEYWFAIDTPPPPSFFSLYTYIFEQINDFFFFLSSYHLVASSTDSAGEKEKKDFVIVRRGTTHTTPVISAYTAKQWDSLSRFLFSLSLFRLLGCLCSGSLLKLSIANLRQWWWHSNNKDPYWNRTISDSFLRQRATVVLVVTY